MSEEQDIQPEDLPRGFRVYETSYLLAPVVAEEAINDEARSLQDIVKSNDGQLIAASEPEFIDLAHTIEYTLNQKKQEFDNAYFGWMHIAVEGKHLEPIQESIDAAEFTLRSLCISLDPSHAGHSPHDAEDDSEDEEDRTEDDEVDTEEMDEAIDELVIEE
jgi:ribosomal protein S6